MRVSRATVYLCLVFIIQWVVMIFIPLLFFKYLAPIRFVPFSVFLDQALKAFISFVLVVLWLVEWMKFGEYLYKISR
jgi:uncharacterized membrane protein (DUF373 family)